MIERLSLRARLVWGAALVLVAFLAGAGWAVQQAHADGVRTARFARLQSTIYLLMAGAELSPGNSVVMPPALAEPLLSLPASGLYANIANASNGEEWQSTSTLGVNPPFRRQLETGQWQYETRQDAASGKDYLAATYAVRWTINDRAAPLVFSVLEDQTAFNREMAIFARTLWGWLGGTGVLLLLTQTLLLQWGLAPLRRIARELSRVESGEQAKVEGRYPGEIAGLTDNLNTLIDQERARQSRYKEALDDLAHSLKTPLAVMRAALGDTTPGPDKTQQMAQQVDRMNDIVVHQLGRAGASGAARFAPLLALAPVLERVRNSLTKVYADKNLTFAIECEPALTWRIDEGDAFEIFGNVMDNAAKWARRAVTMTAWRDDHGLRIRITDDGPGFGVQQGTQQRRVRLDEQVPGHGIGLAVVRDIVASHRGEITLSRSDSGGAQVDITLPAA
jgi:two-component system sensor histidine kinase PhoQ